jgi:hypothetical protein
MAGRRCRTGVNVMITIFVNFRQFSSIFVNFRQFSSIFGDFVNFLQRIGKWLENAKIEFAERPTEGAGDRRARNFSLLFVAEEIIVRKLLFLQFG